MQNRLKLDFTLQSRDERQEFLTKYLDNPQFSTQPPTNEELETMGNYLLWGKDSDGLNAKQKGIHIETRHKTWDDPNTPESLEALIASPTFNENQISALGSTRYKVPKEKFSRKDALANTTGDIHNSFLRLFRNIDQTDLCIQLYEIRHGKKLTPISDYLSDAFTAAEIAQFAEDVSHWNQYRYLKRRHSLVEMRREQYTLRDSYRKQIFSMPTYVPDQEEPFPDFDAGIEVLPLGTKTNTMVSTLLFKSPDQLNPSTFNEDELRLVSDFYWNKQKYHPTADQKWIDFRELEHVYQLFNMYFELRDASLEADMDSNLPSLIQTLIYYTENADLTEVQRDILNLKLKKVRNSDIAATINKKWGKSYTTNYISTIFRQRIIPKINAAATTHEQIISNLFFPEEFKTCTYCGMTLLRNTDNFTRKARSNDGFATRCKRCEKKIREQKGGTISAITQK